MYLKNIHLSANMCEVLNFYVECIKVICICMKRYVSNSLNTDSYVIFSSDLNFVMQLKLTRSNVMQFHDQMHTGSGRDYNLSTHEIRRK